VPAKPTKEELEIRKLQLEIEEKSVGQQFYKTPSFWFSVITAIAAIVGIVGQHFLSEAKFERSAAEAKLAELDKRQAEQKAEKAKDETKAAEAKTEKANDEAKAAYAKAKEAAEETGVVQAKLSKAQKAITDLEAKNRLELDKGTAIEAIKAHKGNVGAPQGGGLGAYFYSTPLSKQDLQELTPRLEKLPDLRSLVLSHVGLTDEGLSALSNLSGLVELRVDGNSELSSDGLAPLHKLGSLQVLVLGQTGIKDPGLDHLKALLELRELSLSDTKVGDQGMAHLVGLANLHVLNLTNTQVSGRGLEQLKSLTQLTNLYLDGSSVTDSGLAQVTGLRRLKLLSLDDRQFTGPSLTNLKNLPDLESLILQGNFDDDSLKLLEGLPGVHTVDVRGTQVTDKGVEGLKRSRPGLLVRRAGDPIDLSTAVVRPGSALAGESDVLPLKRWKTGSILSAQFMDGDAKVHAKVQRVAEEWTDYANLRLDFQPTTRAGEGPEIRITFKEGAGSWSYVGTDCLSVPANQPTMSLGFLTPESPERECSKVVLHEFGHALGLIHEHVNPNADLPWDKEAVYQFYSGPPNFWTREVIDHNFLQKYVGTYREFDPKSVMMYSFPARLFRGDFETTENSALSKSDKEFIAKLYPPDAPAVNLVVGTPPVKGKIATAGQTQYFTFLAPRKSHYTVEADGPAPVVLSIFGPESRTDHVASGATIKQELTTGIYHLLVRHANVRGTGDYSLKITRDKAE
jgi:serralysin